MSLRGLQNLLSEFYALDIDYEVDDFVTTDEQLARALDGGGRQIDEKLLIAENDGEAEVSLYLEQRLLERLERSDPLARLDSDNLEDFWTAFEGVSHFIYYAWNAQREKPVTLLEMELQAEVDKYVATTLLLSRQGQRCPRGLHHWLFELPRLDERLDGDGSFLRLPPGRPMFAAFSCAAWARRASRISATAHSACVFGHDNASLAGPLSQRPTERRRHDPRSQPTARPSNRRFD
jgi:hypothetical protein